MALVHRVRCVWTGVAGSPAYSNFYIQSGAVSAASAQAAVSSYMNSVRVACNTGVTVTIEGDVALVDTATDSIVGVTSTSTTSFPGSGTGSPMPPANQILIRYLTGTFIGGRQVRGRFFVPYLTTGSISSQVVAPATITAMQNATSAYITGLTGNAVVFSRKNGVPVPITAWSTWNQVAVMRSRRD